MLRIFWQLLRRDLLVFRSEYGVKLFDTCILFATNVIVFSYFMGGEGLGPDYGSFFVIGAIASFGLIEIVGKVSVLIADIDGPRTIAHTLIMPIRSFWVFAYIGLFWALTSILLSAPLFLLGKLLLFDRFDLSQMNYLKLIPMYITVSLFFGFFALWLTSLIRGMEAINALWLRIIAPIWMFGAYFYSWHSVFETSALIGYLSLLNPMVYVMEGTRAAALGQEGYLPYWASFGALWVFILACWGHAVVRLRRRLDCL